MSKMDLKQRLTKAADGGIATMNISVSELAAQALARIKQLELIESAARTTLACAAEGPILRLARASLELNRLLEQPPAG